MSAIALYGYIIAEAMYIAAKRGFMGSIRAILFDVFGTTVDWRSSIIAELEEFGDDACLSADWDEFADRWRAGFRELQARIARGDRDWITMDEIHREVLDGLLRDLGASGLLEERIAHLNMGWSRLRPWPDVVEGLAMMKRDFIIGTLSNGNLSLLIALAKYGALPWDCALSTAMFDSYKPNPEVYLGAVRMLDAEPREVMMVAAHAYDVDGAQAAGLRTAYVFRPDEFGIGRGEDPGDTSRFDIAASGFVELAERLRLLE